jgi:hypothetical protein
MVTATVLKELCDIRNKMGYRLAFLLDDRVLLALEIARPVKGASLALKAEVYQEEERTIAASPGSKGGCGCCGAPNRSKIGCSCVGGKSHQCLKQVATDQAKFEHEIVKKERVAANLKVLKEMAGTPSRAASSSDQGMTLENRVNELYRHMRSMGMTEEKALSVALWAKREVGPEGDPTVTTDLDIIMQQVEAEFQLVDNLL